LEFRTASRRTGWLGLAGAAWLFALAFVIILQLTQKPALLLAFALAVALLFDLAALAVVLYRALTNLWLRYRVDRNGLIIVWGATRLVVPMSAIEAVLPARHLNDLHDVLNAPRCWWQPGTHLSSARLPDGREACVRSSLPPADSLAVVTPGRVYLVSPERPDAFVQAWQTRRPLGPTQCWREEQQRTGILALPVWYDRIAWGLLLGTLGAVLFLNGYLTFVYDRLPPTLAFHFDVLGRPDRIGQRAELFGLPILAGIMMILDVGLGFVIYRRERMAAYLIWGGALVLQLLTWGAVYTITG